MSGGTGRRLRIPMDLDTECPRDRGTRCMRPFAELAGSTRVKPSAVTVLLLPGRQYEPITVNDWGDPGGGAGVGLVGQ